MIWVLTNEGTYKRTYSAVLVGHERATKNVGWRRLILDRKAVDRGSAAQEASNQRSGACDQVDIVQANQAVDRQQSRSKSGGQAVVHSCVHARRDVEAICV